LRRIVVKLGTNVIMRADGKVALGLLCGLVEQIAALRGQGIEVLVVSSGSVGLGVERLGLAARPTAVEQVQACAAIGQSRLMALYDDAFDRLDCRIAQVLLTEDDFRDPVRHTNLRATLDALLTLGVIPIVNENDTVSTMELDRPAEATQQERSGKSFGDRNSGDKTFSDRIFGDNDKLSALLMKHINADLLVLLSDVDGLYDRNPALPEAKILPVVEVIDERILALAHGGNGRGRGGMISKLESARIVLDAGKQVVIANGRTPQVLERIVAGEALGTRFEATRFATTNEQALAEVSR
jgi:glutamate 5-kinase